jgi:hypothetical protein
MMQYTLLLMAPYIMTLLTGVGGRTRPMFNITISNVPGPETPLDFRGARMEASYPVSLVSHGQAINITCQSYAGYLHFGFTGCRDSLPHMQHIATYAGDALIELERYLREVEQPVDDAPAKPTRASKKPKLKAATTESTEAPPAERKRPKLKQRPG